MQAQNHYGYLSEEENDKKDNIKETYIKVSLNEQNHKKYRRKAIIMKE